MALASCRGDWRKAKILRLYNVQPGPRCVILPHQISAGLRQECCKQPLEGEFYQFFYRPKDFATYDNEYPRESGSFFVGTTCGKRFIELLQANDPSIEVPELFNPLLPDPRIVIPRHGGGGGGGRPGNPGRIDPTPLNRELIVALQLMASVCVTPMNAELGELLRWLREHPDQDTKLIHISSFNDAISCHQEMAGRSLRQAMNDQRAAAAYRWRDFAFHTIEAILRDEGIVSHVDPDAILPANPPIRIQASVTRALRDGHHRLRLENDGREVVLFANCPGLPLDPPVSIGDLLTIRMSIHPRGDRVVRVHNRSEIGLAGKIHYIAPPGLYAFVRLDRGSPDVHVGKAIYDELGQPALGQRVVVRIRETTRSPEVDWAILEPEPPAHQAP